jgi:replication factor A1
MADLLVPGSLDRIIHAEGDDPVLNSTPVVQFLSIKQVDAKQGGAAQDRYRIIISDGQHYLQSMLATQLNTSVQDGSVGKLSIVRLTRFTINNIRDKR